MASKKATKFQLIWPFFMILLIHCLAIFLFTRGFLLTRTELSHFSNCSDVSLSPCSFSSSSSSSSDQISNGTCWTKPAVDRLVIIVFDALRFDFVAPSSFFPEKKPWMDKLQVIQKLAAETGSSSRIFKAIADPPTTSLQRLKGLTTGGLPTFIDVGNSFGAPAIIEDNFIQQLVENGKRVVMMGDDTWLQLFPHHFEKSFPYPSFNVKDLDTVDNGCIDHLLPSLYEENWDVLIAHFLGVDHAGHIFGVDTEPMIQKLEQYNRILEEVVEALKNQSAPGSLHENTLLVVMGDHGQTLNGDHDGGSPEEVETSIFAMSSKNVPSVLPPELDSVSCGLNMDAKQICIGTIEQLDFAVTMSTMLGVPSPFGRCSLQIVVALRFRGQMETAYLVVQPIPPYPAWARASLKTLGIGRVNPQLYALGAGSLLSQGIETEKHSDIMRWMQHYVNILCINAWQVKRYIDVYSASSVIGFSSEDLFHVEHTYSQAQENWLHVVRDSLSCADESCASFTTIKRQIDIYLRFLDTVIGLARSKWTEFNLNLMVGGLSIIFLSLFVQLLGIKRVNKFCESSVSAGRSKASIGLVFAIFVTLVRACSFLSNSYILEEGRVAIYFLGTAVLLVLRYTVMKTKMLLEATILTILVCALRFVMEFGLSKQAANSSNLASVLAISQDHPFWIFLSLIVPILVLFLLAYLLFRCVSGNSAQRVQNYVILGTILCYVLISVHWVLESNLLSFPLVFHHIGRVCIPRLIYVLGIAQLVSLSMGQLLCGKRTAHFKNDITMRAVALLSACSSTIILLLGRQGSFVALASFGAAWCITKLANTGQAAREGSSSNFTFYSLPLTQWSLLAVALFFCTGHWCAFDGLRYGAAFVGFDEFMLVRQAILLAIDTFGFSHLLPIFGLPLLVTQTHSNGKIKEGKLSTAVQICQVFLMYGFITTTAVTFTVLCVTIQRRHLMVWGLFAPKYVFDVVGLILADVLICLASLYYIDPVEDSSKQN